LLDHASLQCLLSAAALIAFVDCCLIVLNEFHTDKSSDISRFSTESSEISWPETKRGWLLFRFSMLGWNQMAQAGAAEWLNVADEATSEAFNGSQKLSSVHQRRLLDRLKRSSKFPLNQQPSRRPGNSVSPVQSKMVYR
jgi:hypothetical protein